MAASARRDLRRLPEKIATAALEAMEAIEDNPYRMGKPLKLELEGFWAARRGPYRIIYEIDANAQSIKVVTIAHRSDVYRSK